MTFLDLNLAVDSLQHQDYVDIHPAVHHWIPYEKWFYIKFSAIFQLTLLQDVI